MRDPPDPAAGASPDLATAAELQAEADAALSLVDPVAGAGLVQELAPPVDAAKEFREVLHLPVMFVSSAVLPQWNITDEFRTEWTEATAECLAQLFPDGLNGKYACWFRLIAATGVIAVNGIAKNGGKLPGIGRPPQVIEAPEHGSASPA